MTTMMMQEPSSVQLLAQVRAAPRRVPCIMPSCNGYLIQGQLYYSIRYIAYLVAATAAAAAVENKLLRN